MLRLLANILVGTALALLLFASGSLLVLKQTGSRALSVQSGSMAPVIKKGDLVVVKSVPHYHVGDIITYTSPSNRNVTVTHRIIALKPNGTLQTKGDANHSADHVISKGRIVGQVQHMVPRLGYGIDFVRKPLGLLLIIYIPAVLIIAHEFRLLTGHYKKMQPYLAPGRTRQHKNPRSVYLAAGKLLLVCLVGSLLIVIPARAALFSQTALVGNSITAVKQTLADHILLRRVEFECSRDNTRQRNKLPSIIMHNPTAQDTKTGGWYIESSGGRLVTFRPQTIFDAHDDYDIEPDLKAGVQYQGDFLALFDATGKLVDAISWGTDTTYLNPPLPGTQDGTVFRRVDLKFETKTVADWSVSVAACRL